MEYGKFWVIQIGNFESDFEVKKVTNKSKKEK